jgi:hypothetical protein
VKGTWWRPCKTCLPLADGSPRHHYEGTRNPKHVTKPALTLVQGGKP